MHSTRGRERRGRRSAAAALLSGALLAGAIPGEGPAPARAQSDRGASSDTLVRRADGVVLRSPPRPTALAAGARVRLWTASDGNARVDGWIDRVKGERVVLVAPRGTSEREILLADLRRVEVETDRNARKHGAMVGLALGAVVGGIAGALIGAANEPDCTSDEWMCFQGLTTFAGVMGGIGLGGLLGAGVGWLVTPDGWVDVPVGDLQAATIPGGIAARVPIR